MKQKTSTSSPDPATAPAPILNSPLNAHILDILDSLPDGVFTVDSDWKITTINRAGQKILGLAAGEGVGRFCYQVIRATCCRNDCPLAETLKTGANSYNYEVSCPDYGTSGLELMVNTAILRDSAGTPTGGVISFRDMTLFRGNDVRERGASDFHGIVGQSALMRELYSLIEDVADSRATVLIEGESGTGKELVARAIQQLSKRRDKPFVRINCAAFSETLLESELFGHVKGAFTDAVRERPGRFELAHGGTILLDEIGEASSAVQVRLLRVLQEREFERVGGIETIAVDVRVIAATNRPLARLVQEGTFREDLFFRLNVFPISIPPLRQRLDDLRQICEYFLDRLALIDKRRLSLSKGTFNIFAGHRWPGNVRELENALEYASVRCQGDVIQASHLPATIHTPLESFRNRHEVAQTADRSEPEMLEVRKILDALSSARWNRGEAARMLGTSRTTLWRKMSRLGLFATDRSTAG